MKLSAPTQALWLIAVVLGVLGLLGYFGIVPQLAAYAFGLEAIAFGLLTLGTLFKGL